MAKLDSVEIKEKLQKAFPRFKFSVTRDVYAGGHSVAIRVLSGNIKAMKDDSQTAYISGLEYVDNSDALTPQMNSFLSKVKDIINQVGNYNSRHGSSYAHLSLGTYNKPYVMNANSTPTSAFSSSRSTSGRSNFDYGDKLGSGNGWDLYKKYISEKDVNVYNLVKKPETKPNREKWNEIKGLLLTQEAFKWNPRGQTFQRWYKGDLTEVSMANLFRILGEYYDGSQVDMTSMPTQDEAQPEPQQPQTQPTPSGIMREITDREAREVADAFMEKDDYAHVILKISSASDVYQNQELQDKYVDYLKRAIGNLMNTPKFNYLKSEILNKSLYKVFERIENENFNLLNNFLCLYGFFGAEKQREYNEEYRLYPDVSLKPFVNEPEALTQTPTNKDKFEPNDRFNFLSGRSDRDVVWVVDRLDDENIYIYREGFERSTSWNWTTIKIGKEFISDGMIRFLEPLSESETTPTPPTTNDDEIKIFENTLLIYRETNRISLVVEVKNDRIKTEFFDFDDRVVKNVYLTKNYWVSKIKSGEVIRVRQLEKGDIFEYGNEKDTYYVIKEINEADRNINYDVLNGRGEVIDSIDMYEKTLLELLISNPFYWTPIYPFRQPQLTQKEKLEKAIKGLQYLADKGNENAKKAIKGLKYLLNK
jgi:hypothetical protein